MKKLILSLIILFPFFKTISAQELVMITDSINKFQIGAPVGWSYLRPQENSTAFQAFRLKVDEDDKPRENYNIGFMQHKETDLNKEYKNFISAISKRTGFRIIDQKDKIINGRKYKYLIETHKNIITQEDMTDCILFTNNNGEILQLTMVTISENFDKYRSLFDRIAESLKY